MLVIKNLNVNLAEGNKVIIKNLSLTIKPGEIHLLNGKNGSGKSTLVNAVMGNPNYHITSGSITIDGEEYDEFLIKKLEPENINKVVNDIYDLDLSAMSPTERSLVGLFLANQYPVEIPGVSLMSYLRLIYNSHKPKELQLNVYKFKQFLLDKAKLINYPEHLLKRNLNEGFSGGEKKKTEILQMIILEPRYIFLDEIDSGLDRQSVQEVFEGIAKFKEQSNNASLIIISHYDRAQEYLKPTKIHEMNNGVILE